MKTYIRISYKVPGTFLTKICFLFSTFKGWFADSFPWFQFG